MQHFIACNRFIMKCAMRRGRVLVHCRAGVSRSFCDCVSHVLRVMAPERPLSTSPGSGSSSTQTRISSSLHSTKSSFGKSSVKPLLSLHEWDIYRLRELLCQAGIESFVPDSKSCVVCWGCCASDRKSKALSIAIWTRGWTGWR